jgi:hypothetical protein
MNKQLTFLLSLTFLFLFSGSVYGIDFGKSEEAKYKGTNIGVHLCRKTNLDILKNSYLRDDTSADISSFKKEAILIEKRCLRKHEQKSEKSDWIDTNDSHFLFSKDIGCELMDELESLKRPPVDIDSKNNCIARSFKAKIKNNSKNKIITYISITINHKDNQGKLDSFGYLQNWTLPNQYVSIYEEENTTKIIKFFPKKDRVNKELLDIEIDEVRYVDFVLKE